MWNAMQSQSVTLILRFADSGWHVRWRTPNTEAFHAVLEEFKALLDLTERYWDPEAFEKGGWWVAYGALGKVGHLFGNYQAVRDELEREHWQRYEQQRQTNEAAIEIRFDVAVVGFIQMEVEALRDTINAVAHPKAVITGAEKRVEVLAENTLPDIDPSGEGQIATHAACQGRAGVKE